MGCSTTTPTRDAYGGPCIQTWSGLSCSFHLIAHGKFLHEVACTIAAVASFGPFLDSFPCAIGALLRISQIMVPCSHYSYSIVYLKYHRMTLEIAWACILSLPVHMRGASKFCYLLQASLPSTEATPVGTRRRPGCRAILGRYLVVE